MNKFIYVLLITLFLGVKSFGQVENPVSWGFSTEFVKDGTYNLKFKAKIEDKWHLYSQNLSDGGPVPTSFKFEKNPGCELIGKVRELSKAESVFDKSFEMQVSFFSHEAVFVQKIKVKTSEAFKVKGTVEYMSCNDQKCLPPKEIGFSFDIPETKLSQLHKETIVPMPSRDTLVASGAAADSGNKNAVRNQQRMNAPLSVEKPRVEEEGSLWLFFLGAFLAGFAGIFTPCVYPMIPMTVSFFMRGSEKKMKGIFNGLFFGLSIIFIYTLIGVVVAITQSGAGLTTYISTHWLPNSIFFMLFLLFAASFFGMFELVLPGSLSNKIDKQVDKGGIAAPFFMALTLVVVSFSCTIPFVGSILVLASKGVALKPILGMFGYSLAFAIPFMIFAISPTLLKKLSKSGAWLNSVKVVMAFLLLAFSLKFLLAIDSTYHFNILSREIYLAIWIVLFSMLGFYLMGKIKFAHDDELPYIGVPRLILAIATFSFVVYIIPGMFGAPLNAISSMLPVPSNNVVSLAQSDKASDQSANICGTPKYSEFLEFRYNLKGYFDYEEGMACAKKLNKPVFLDFNGHACSNCKKMEAEVWSDTQVQERLRKDFVLISLYVDDRFQLPEKEFVKSVYDGYVKKAMGTKNLDFEITKFQINTQPLYAILDLKGNVLAKYEGLNTNIASYLRFLQEGKEAFDKKK